MSLTHLNIETDLEKAKDGRWVLLIEPDVGDDRAVDGPTWDDSHIPPVVIAKWVVVSDGTYGAWSYLYAAGQGEGYYIAGAKGFVELSDLGLFKADEDDDEEEQTECPLCKEPYDASYGSLCRPCDEKNHAELIAEGLYDDEVRFGALGQG